MKQKLIALLTCILLLTSICFIPDVDAGNVTLNITNQTQIIEVGKSFNIKLNGIKAKKVKWSSSNTSVVTVSKNGVGKGISKGKATITGKYKGIKFTIKVDVYGDDSYSENDISFAFKSAKVTKRQGKKSWKITFTFTNKGSKGVSFYDKYFVEAYDNDIECDPIYEENYYTKVRNGASVDVDFFVTVKSGDHIDFSVLKYTKNYDKKKIYQKAAHID